MLMDWPDGTRTFGYTFLDIYQKSNSWRICSCTHY